LERETRHSFPAQFVDSKEVLGTPRWLTGYVVYYFGKAGNPYLKGR